jgi:hypothetical protein
METEVFLFFITWIFIILGWVFFELTILPIVFFLIAMALSIFNLHLIRKSEKKSK